MRNSILSFYVYWCCVALMCYASFFFYPKWQQTHTEATLSWDVSGYYWYLPSIFIYKDIRHQSFRDSILNKYTPTPDFQQCMPLGNGNYVMKYSSGMAIMYLPFFMAAHTLAKPSGYPADGFSRPYQLSIHMGGLLISLIGLWYLRKLMLYYYTDRVVAIIMMLLVAGSNYMNYAAIDCGMSHTWLFTVYVFILLNTHYFYLSFNIKYAIRIGLLIGLAALTRPTDIISCIIPLLWGLNHFSQKEFTERALLLAKQYRKVAAAIVSAISVISIQLFYWKYASGHWLVYSYGDQGFSWSYPHAILYALNYRSGWLTYTPTMVFAFVGIIAFLEDGKNKVAILTFFAINYYIVSAWDIWWYGGRAMIQSYPVLLFPMASLVNMALSKKIVLWIWAPLALCFIYYNVWITYHYHRDNLYDSECMNKVYYWRVMGHWQVPERTMFLRDNTEIYELTPTDTQLIYSNSFEHDTGTFYTTDIISNKPLLRLDKEHQESPHYSFQYSDSKTKWLRVQGTFRCDKKEYDVWKMAQMVVRVKTTDNRIVKENMIRVYRALENRGTGQVAMDIKLPHTPFSSVDISFLNCGSEHPLWIGDLKVWSYNK